MKSEIEKAQDKESFIDHFRGMYSRKDFPSDWNDAKIEKVKSIARSTSKTGLFSSIPMTCRGPKCPFADTCPLQKQDIAPIGSPCPIEMTMVIDFVDNYIEQLHIDDNNLIEVCMVRELVDQEVQSLRKSKWLAKEDMIQENVIGITANGEVALRKELHMAVELEDKILRRKQILLKQLLATREAQAKVGLGTLDTAQTMANLMSQVATLTQMREKVKMEELGLIPKDEYIETAEIIEEDETEEYE